MSTGSTIYVSPATDIALGFGYRIDDNSPRLELAHVHWGALVSQQWRAFSPITGGLIWVLKLLLASTPCDKKTGAT